MISNIRYGGTTTFLAVEEVMSEKMLKAREVAEIYNVGVPTVYSWCKNYEKTKFPHRKVGKQYRFLRSEILNFGRKQEQKSTEVSDA